MGKKTAKGNQQGSKPGAESRAKQTGARVHLGLGWALLVLLVGFGVRAGVAHELGRTVLYQEPQLDAKEFLDWGRDIAQGNLGLPAFPTHGPGYPLFLGSLLALTGSEQPGDSLQGVRLLQALLGGVTCLLVALLAGRAWGRRAGVLAGLVLAFHGPLVMAETALWEDGLLLFLLTALLYAFDAGRQRPVPAALASGSLLGLAVLVRPTPLVLLPVLLALLAWPADSNLLRNLLRRLGSGHPQRVSSWIAGWSWPRRAVPAIILVAACAALVVPAVVWVSNAVGEFLFLRGFGAINLYIGNDPAGGGLQNARVGGDWDLLESAPQRAGINEIGKLEGFYTDLALSRMASDPAGLLAVLASKAAWLTQAEEPRDNHSYSFFQARSKLLRRLPGYGWLFALAALGIVVAVRRRQLPPVLVAYLTLMALVVIATLMGMRYRLPLVPALAAFAGLALSHLVDLATGGDRRKLAAWLVALAVMWGLTHLRHHPESHVFAEEWTFTGSSLIKQDRIQEAEVAFQTALQEDPSSGIAWDGIGRLRIQQKRWQEAVEALQNAVDNDPNLRRAHYHLALAQKTLGQTDQAIESLRQAVAIAPTYALALRELGSLLAARGDLDGAAAALETLRQQTPDDVQVLHTLAQIQGARDQAAEGLAHARHAAELSGDAESWMLLGFLGVQAKSADDTRLAASRLEQALGKDDPRYRLLAGAAIYFEGDPRAAQRVLLPLVSEYPGNAPATSLLLETADAAGNRAEIEAFLSSESERRR